MSNDKSKTDESVDKIREQAKITASDLVKSVEGSIKSGYTTYPGLMEILNHFSLQVINEMVKFRFELPELSLEELGLKELHDALENLKKREQRKK